MFIFDYRGYGQSEGKPSEQGLYRDGAAAWRFLTEQKQFAPQNIVIFGRSLGGAVAAKLAADVQARGLRNVNFPILVLHSPDDEIMPFHLGKKVYASANEPKRFVNMRGDHNSGFYLSQPEYEQALANWLKTLQSS